MNKGEKELGKFGEELAEKFLIESGFKVVARNYRFGKGEIDIIAEDPEDDYLVFIEVKTRNPLEYGAPEYSITPGKQKQIKKIAGMYLIDNEIDGRDCRFDVVTVIVKNRPVIQHYRNAFF